MIFHVCSHWGDIEVEACDETKSLIRYFKLTPLEREALDVVLNKYNINRSEERGEIVVPESVVIVGGEIGDALHGDTKKLTAIRFSNGEVKVTREPVVPWYRRLMDKMSGVIRETTTTLVPPEAVVQTPIPKRGCPMPTMTDLREAKAAGVVRKFLIGQQIEDFNRRRAFLAVGSDTGTLYRVTSRWSPDVEKYGVLYNIDQQRTICARNGRVPPSEEVLSMKFVVENIENAFLNGPHG